MSLTKTYNPKLANSVWWNLFLLTSGSLLYALGIQAVAAPQGFLTGGVMGVALLLWYDLGIMTPPVWYMVLCIPVFVVGWFSLGRRFLLYSLYGTLCTTCWGMVITFSIPVQDELYAAVLVGVLSGAGSGIMLRSLGSAGGTDIVAVILKERWNISIGKFSFIFNAAVFAVGLFSVSIDLIIASTIAVFISSNTLDYVLGLFNQRKMVLIISGQGEAICEAIILAMKFGVTFLRGKGGYLGADREVILTVTNNMALKKLEGIVFSIDPNALFIVENTFYVSGGQFSRVDPS